ncbi:patatin-like phospholipase family protein [Corallincola spongiicola]|uniref:Patatin-like phospholipase family protein n=1 Tax=Corallincola spongiicola TaxID=2520508 RepID=A0ABY1WS21_9GAMM|nr:patatin-like phospholipase family protein [Corallincola spongiicola]TAA47329.1 patatin-like phospholipase family protein [Corallincola spongiicola]
MTSALRVLAGKTAREHIQQKGLSPDDIKVLVGASGGPKWFVLAPLDRYLGGDYFKSRKTPLQLLGSSAGAFRFSCLAQDNAPAVTQRFLDGYTQLRYPEGASAQQITEISQQLLDHVFSKDSVSQILSHPTMRLNVIAARAKHINSSERKALQMLGLGLTASANAVHRRLLGGFFERTIFHHPKDKADFLSVRDLPTQTVALNQSNLIDAVMASGSIPMIMEGIKNIAGARPGNYRDGGITDYHFDLPFCHDGIVLYPHFSSKTIPGWFDKGLRWRKPNPAHYDNVIMLVPSEQFIAKLPNRKIPDRKDFSTMDDHTRLKAWRMAIAESERLSDEFGNLIANPAALLAALEPLN